MASSYINYADSSTRPLVGGAGVTVMRWNGSVIGFCQSVTVTYPTAIADAVQVQPLDAVRPVEIVTSKAITGGSISLTLTTLYNQQIWDRFLSLAGTHDLADIFAAVQKTYYTSGGSAGQSKGLYVERVIQPNTANGTIYIEQFLNCVVTAVSDGAAIDPTTMLINREMTLQFTQHKKSTGWSNYAKPDPTKLVASLSGLGLPQ